MAAVYAAPAGDAPMPPPPSPPVQIQMHDPPSAPASALALAAAAPPAAVTRRAPPADSQPQRVPSKDMYKGCSASPAVSMYKDKVRLNYDDGEVQRKLAAINLREHQVESSRLSHGKEATSSWRLDTVGAAKEYYERQKKRVRTNWSISVIASVHIILVFVVAVGVHDFHVGVGGPMGGFLESDPEVDANGTTTGPPSRDNIRYHALVATMSFLNVLQAVQLTRWYLIRNEDLQTFDHLWKGVPMWHSPLCRRWLYEMALIAIHEPPGLVLVLRNAYKLNLIVLFRFYFFFRSFRTRSMPSTQAGRLIMQLSRSPNDVWFAIQYWNSVCPMYLMLTTTIIGWLMFSCAIYMAEDGVLSPTESLWFIFITATTVGYGDFYPATELGRVVVYFTACFGTVMNALLTSILMVKLTLSAKQEKAVSFMSEAQSHSQIERLASDIVGQAWVIQRRRRQLRGQVGDSSAHNELRSAERKLKWLCYSFRKVRSSFQTVQDDVHSTANVGALAEKIAGMERMVMNLFRVRFPLQVLPAGPDNTDTADCLVRVVKGTPTIVIGRPAQRGKDAAPPPAPAAAAGAGALNGVAHAPPPAFPAADDGAAAGAVPAWSLQLGADLRLVAEQQRRVEVQLRSIAATAAGVAARPAGARRGVPVTLRF